jgi:hypothetical protein
LVRFNGSVEKGLGQLRFLSKKAELFLTTAHATSDDILKKSCKT